MAHPSQHPDVIARRWAEHERATSVAELNQLYRKWGDEDAAAEQQKAEPTRIAQLERRLNRLEKFIGMEHVRGPKTMPERIGDVINKLCAELRDEIDGVRKERNGSPTAMTYHGVWAVDRAYPAGATTTHNGAAWVATRATLKGERPHTSDGWTLAAKSDNSELRRIVREELASAAKTSGETSHRTVQVPARGYQTRAMTAGK